jgi:hypothetical protein
LLALGSIWDISPALLHPLGLLQPIDATAQLVELPLPGQTQILEQ